MIPKGRPANPLSDSPDARSGRALRERAEALAAETAGDMPENQEVLLPEAARRALHELRVHQIELEMQNEELRLAHAELDAARARYFDLYDLAPVGYCTISGRGVILEANLTAALLLGEARDALVHKSITGFILKEDQDIYYRHRKQLIDTGDPQECELRMIKSDRTVFWVRLHSTAARDANGEAMGRLVLSDITARRQAEEAVRHLSQFNQEVISGAAEGIVVYDRELRYLAWNPFMEALTGLPGSDVLGKCALDIFPHLREHGVDRLLNLALDGEIVRSQDTPFYIAETGHSGWVTGTYAPHHNGSGQIIGVIATIHDVTPRKRAEAAQYKGPGFRAHKIRT